MGIVNMDELLNFHQSTETIGTAGQPTREQFKKIAEQGYSSVVNLAMHDSDNAIPEEGNIVSSLGMSYFHMPVPFDRPTAEHLKKFIRIMYALEGEKVFVHCALNARVSAFMYKYLTLCKSVGEAESTSPLLRQWLPQMDEAWKSIIRLSADEVG
ncbi:protein tyrosine phosphatase family protein [Pseudohongiella acticola]|uniref:protein tyrosine phosphatase family protein n=1 Tax=Pseudohongiella acticola TaxID=1524254 RepID=UPI0030EDF94B